MKYIKSVLVIALSLILIMQLSSSAVLVLADEANPLLWAIKREDTIPGLLYKVLPDTELVVPYTPHEYTLVSVLPTYIPGGGGVAVPVKLSVDVDESLLSGVYISSLSMQSGGFGIMNYKFNVVDYNEVPIWAQPAVKYVCSRNIIPVEWSGFNDPLLGLQPNMLYEYVYHPADEAGLESAYTEYIPQMYFHPADIATRASFCYMLRSLVIDAASGGSSVPANAYMYQLPSNINPSSWYAVPVSWALHHGMVTNTGLGEYNASGPITRLEVCYGLYAMVQALGFSLPTRFTQLGFEDAEDVPEYYRQVVDSVVWAGIMVGDDNNRFNPDEPITRAELAVAFYNAIQWFIRNHPSMQNLEREEASNIKY